jgi:hypothetical protein
MPERRHESQEPNLRGLMTAGLIMAAAIVVAVGVCLGLVGLFGGSQAPRARTQHNPMPEPHLQPHPLGDRARYEQGQHAKLTEYAWIDRPAGIVRIPIARAMRILAKQHGPAGAPAPASAAGSGP